MYRCVILGTCDYYRDLQIYHGLILAACGLLHVLMNDLLFPL